jgi:2-methylcitrate dehydratase PrpD
MDAFLEIVQEEELRPEDVREIRLQAGPSILEPLRYERPVNELQAKFSLQFGLSSILVRRRAGLREYTNEFVTSDEIRETMNKVKTILDPEIARMGTDKMRSLVEVELKDGRVITRVAETARGTPEKPLKNAERYDKFRECVGFALDEAATGQVLRTIESIEGVTDIRELTSLLSPNRS